MTFLCACNLTLTTSNGFITTASVSPELSPASAKIWRKIANINKNVYSNLLGNLSKYLQNGLALIFFDSFKT